MVQEMLVLAEFVVEQLSDGRVDEWNTPPPPVVTVTSSAGLDNQADFGRNSVIQAVEPVPIELSNGKQPPNQALGQQVRSAVCLGAKPRDDVAPVLLRGAFCWSADPIFVQVCWSLVEDLVDAVTLLADLGVGLDTGGTPSTVSGQEVGVAEPLLLQWIEINVI